VRVEVGNQTEGQSVVRCGRKAGRPVMMFQPPKVRGPKRAIL
jgi:hypothetical protein